MLNENQNSVNKTENNSIDDDKRNDYSTIIKFGITLLVLNFIMQILL